jgi:hypothetical protein
LRAQGTINLCFSRSDVDLSIWKRHPVGQQCTHQRQLGITCRHAYTAYTNTHNSIVIKQHGHDSSDRRSSDKA